MAHRFATDCSGGNNVPLDGSLAVRFGAVRAQVDDGCVDVVGRGHEGRTAGAALLQWTPWPECRRAGAPHRLACARHSFASHRASGGPLKADQEIIGHATIEMTMRYAHLGPSVRRDAVPASDGPAPAIGQPTPGQIASAGSGAKG